MSLKSMLAKNRGKGVIVLSLIGSLVVVYFVYLLSGLPSLEQLENPKVERASKVYSVDGELIDQFFIKNRTSVSLNELPKELVNALIATEDKDFYDHWGVDVPRFAKAMVKNIFSLKLREGASTITQQLSRNLYEFKGQNESVFGKVTRKLREFITAVQIERNYTKQEILEMYFSVSYFGRSAYGIASGAQVYFAKKPSELTLSESALLIGMLKGPSIYDPIKHLERSLNRRNTVLGQMVKYEYITEKEEKKAEEEQMEFEPFDEELSTGIAPHFVEWVRQQLLQKAEKYGFDIYRDGLSIYTTLDSRMQRAANRAVSEHFAEIQPRFTKQWNWKNHKDELTQAIAQTIRTSDVYRDAAPDKQDSIARSLRNTPAFVDSVKREAARIEVGFTAIDHRNGNILAMVGGSRFRTFKYGLNHVTQIKRQPGSAFKPFVYTVAVDNGYPPCFELLNQPVTLVLPNGKRWAPVNFDHSFGGKMSLREGIKHSVNLVAIRAIMEIAPVQQVVKYAHRMGIKSELPPYESLAIGTGEVQPLEIISAYGIFPNEGVYVEPISILKIEDKDGHVIEENQPARREVLSPETAYIMTDMLEESLKEGPTGPGTAIRVRNYYYGPAAGKTGTTQEAADTWFIGFTPQITAGVWVGFDNKSVHFNQEDGQGGRAAAPIWGRFMKYVYEDPDIALPVEYFAQPPNVERDTICVETKKIATQYCPQRTEEVFNKKYPPGRCEKHTSWVPNDGNAKNTINF
ncbi:MAG TPA: PBP1A family penicillin-binding protein [Bacteroidota bacterium]|jgi:penicillin-binding protein 1A|nr:PBP1A family penicillin-binding protein [Bacteroidota bacterium]